MIFCNFSCGSLIQPPNSKAVATNDFAFLWQIMYINMYIDYKLIIACYELFPQLHYI